MTEAEALVDIDETLWMDRGRELSEVLRLAARFPARHDAIWDAPIFPGNRRTVDADRRQPQRLTAMTLLNNDDSVAARGCRS